VQEICELQLGRSPLTVTANAASANIPPITVAELVDYLKQIQASIKFWSKQRGRQGYLSYINELLG
jgi:hypothetical protein